MRKTDRKIDNAITKVLTDACELALGHYEGFKWLTHLVNYDDFPGSLSVVCIFDTNANLSGAAAEEMRALIKKKLASIDVRLDNSRRQVSFDTEENCRTENNGRWRERLRSRERARDTGTLP